MPSEEPFRDGRAAGFALFETLRWEPGRGLIRKELHLRRLAESAAALDFAYDRDRIEACLDRLDGQSGMQRVRLTLQPDGACELTHSPFEQLPDGAVWRLALAHARIDEHDELVRHKTTRRAIYEAARAEFPPDKIDEVILLNRAGMVCEGTITNVFLRGADGVLETPPVAAGLLPGVLRAELLEAGKARQAAIGPYDLAQAAEIFIGNSLRGLIPAKLAGPLPSYAATAATH